MPGEQHNDDVRAAFDDDDTDLTTDRPAVMHRREAPVASLATEPPRSDRRRPGRWHWSIRVGIAALVGYGLGLITPTPEGIEVSDEPAEDEVRIEIEATDGQRFVVENANDMAPSELQELIDDLVEAARAPADAGG